jgi:chorismate mutase/prephenate dehydratase
MTGGDEKAGAPNLDEIRKEINEIDERLQTLINDRAKIAQQVGVAKGDLASAVDYYRPEREAEVLRKVLDRNDGPMRDEEMLRLFREIMSACLAQQEPLKIGFLGPEGTFTQTAVHKHFGHSVRALPFHTIDETFQEVECGAADFGVVPIENSTEGSVNNTLDMFLTSPLKIAGEIELKIEQHLMSKNKGLDKIERICAHEQSLAQCRGWIRENLPHEILVNNIEDRPDNATRFLVIGRNLLAPSGDDKTTLLLSTSDTAGGAGVLHSLLQPLATHGVSMTRIESRPSRRKKWDYVFFIDVEGHAEESPVADALAELEKSASLFKVLGAYPKAIG